MMGFWSKGTPNSSSASNTAKKGGKSTAHDCPQRSGALGYSTSILTLANITQRTRVPESQWPPKPPQASGFLVSVWCGKSFCLCVALLFLG